MTDIITYCIDTAALVAELQEKLPDLIDIKDPENPRFCVDKTPTIRNGNKTLALLLVDDNQLTELETLDSLQILGTFEEVFEDPEKKAIYDSVYIREYTYIDENGDEQTGLKPEKFGVFAR